MMRHTNLQHGHLITTDQCMVVINPIEDSEKQDESELIGIDSKQV
jgi:hypothetical protein